MGSRKTSDGFPLSLFPFLIVYCFCFSLQLATFSCFCSFNFTMTFWLWYRMSVFLHLPLFCDHTLSSLWRTNHGDWFRNGPHLTRASKIRWDFCRGFWVMGQGMNRRKYEAGAANPVLSLWSPDTCQHSRWANGWKQTESYGRFWNLNPSYTWGQSCSAVSWFRNPLLAYVIFESGILSCITPKAPSERAISPRFPLHRPHPSRTLCLSSPDWPSLEGQAERSGVIYVGLSLSDLKVGQREGK